METDVKSIRESLQECLASFKKRLSHSLDRHTDAALFSQLDRLKIWAGNLGVFAKANASADFRFREDGDLRAMIVGVIHRISRTIIERQDANTLQGPGAVAQGHLVLPTSLAVENQIPEGHVSSSSASSDNDTLDISDNDGEESVPSTWVSLIERLINQLFFISSVVRKPIRYQDNARIHNYSESAGHDRDELKALESHIEFQIRRASCANEFAVTDRVNGEQVASEQDEGQCATPSRELIQRIVNAGLFRRNRILYRRRHEQKLKSGIKQAFESLPTAPVGNSNHDTTPSSERPQALLEANEKPVGSTASAVSYKLSATEASSVLPLPQGMSKRQAPTSVVSRTALIRHAELDIPARPLNGSVQDVICPYCCIACGDVLDSVQKWRKHVLDDLEPYICVFNGCGNGDLLYRSTNDWMHHMQTEHCTIWACNTPEHDDEVFDTPQELANHFRRQHELSFSENQLQVLVTKCARYETQSFQICPICSQSVDDASVEGQKVSLEDDTQRIFDYFRNHVAKHLEYLSLFSLPAARDMDEAASAEKERASSDKDGISSRSDGLDQSLSNALDDTLSEVSQDIPPPIQDAAILEQWVQIRQLVLDSRPAVPIGEDDVLQPFIWGILFNYSPEIDKIVLGEQYNTRLQAAVGNGIVSAVGMLLTMGGDANTDDKKCGSLLQIAVRNSQLRVATLLLDRGAHVDAVGARGVTPLQLAAEEGQEDIIRLLLSCGADVHAVSGRYGTALQAAAGNGRESAVRMILEAGAIVNANAGEYGSALQLAAYNGHEKIVRLLLEHGADVRSVRELRRIGTAQGRLDAHNAVVRLLRQHGAVNI